jgi:hypothetical protein
MIQKANDNPEAVLITNRSCSPKLAFCSNPPLLLRCSNGRFGDLNRTSLSSVVRTRGLWIGTFCPITTQ